MESGVRRSWLMRLGVWLDKVARLSGIPLVCLCIGLNIWVISIYFRVALPLLFSTKQIPSFFVYMHVAITLLIIFNIAFNYFVCILTDPGSAPNVPESMLDKVQPVVDSSSASTANNTPQRIVIDNVLWKICLTCKTLKDERTHHCSICKRCIRKMDHHCPWFAKCVGRNNYRYFYLYVLYTWIGVIHGTVLVSGLLYLHKSSLSEDDRRLLVAVLILCSVVDVLVGLLLRWHTRLLLKNMTTLEAFVESSKSKASKNRAAAADASTSSDFDLGKTKNIEAVFGPVRSVWMIILPSLSKLPDSMDVSQKSDASCRI